MDIGISELPAEAPKATLAGVFMGLIHLLDFSVVFFLIFQFLASTRPVS